MLPWLGNLHDPPSQHALQQIAGLTSRVWPSFIIPQPGAGTLLLYHCLLEAAAGPSG